MFNLLLNKILYENFLNISSEYENILVKILLNEQAFKKFITKSVPESDTNMIDQLLDFYETDKIGAIHSALIWKSYVTKNADEQILLDYSLEPPVEYTINIVFYFYNVKSQTIKCKIYNLYGKSKAIFNNMQSKNESVQKIYNVINTYGQRIY